MIDFAQFSVSRKYKSLHQAGGLHVNIFLTIRLVFFIPLIIGNDIGASEVKQLTLFADFRVNTLGWRGRELRQI